jgi:hypothetical protein
MAAEHHHFSPAEMEEWYTFRPELRRKLILGMIIGLVMLVVGAFLMANHIGGGDHAHEAAGAAHDHAHGAAPWLKRVVANLWMNADLFAGIAVVGMFFVCIQYLSWAGWSSVLKRVPEAFAAFLPIPAAIMIILFLLNGADIFHWLHEGIMDPASEHYDAVIAGKSWYLNKWFFFLRLVFYFGSWYGLWLLLRKYSVQEDELGGTEWWYKMKIVGRIFILVFAVTSSTAAWDWMMSIDTHWFSTMYGWYHFASWHVTGLAVIILAIIYLKEDGYLRWVNENHLHDLGKFVFAFSIFWTYVWFAQFLLIYYAHLPEETIYFYERLYGYNQIYQPTFWLAFILSFVFPFLVLMTRDAKRNSLWLKIGSFGVILGHYFDFYNMSMPGIVGNDGGFGLIELGTVLLFASGFGLVVHSQLTKASLVAKNHPMLEEALHHDI